MLNSNIFATLCAGLIPIDPLTPEIMQGVSVYQPRALAGTHFCPTEGSRLSWPKWLVKILKLPC